MAFPLPSRRHNGGPALFGGSYDSDFLLWYAAARANGAVFTGARITIANQFFVTEKANGTWTLTDDYWGLWGEDAAQALTSLKQRRLAVATNSPTFTASRDYTFDGATNYLDLGFIPSTHAVAMAAANVRLGIYERVNLTSSGYSMGVNSSANRTLRVRSRSGTTVSNAENDNGSSYSLPSADSRGFTTSSRNGATAADCAAYKNGAALTRTGDATLFGVALPIISLFVGGYNSTGVLTSPRANAVGFVVAGAALSAAQELLQYNAIQAWATAIGANV